MEINKVKKIYNLALVSDVLTAFGNYIEFKLYEDSLKYEDKYEDAKVINDIVSFVSKSDISDFIRTEDEKSNDVINRYNELQESLKKLKKNFGITNYVEIFNELEKLPKISTPQYYMSLTILCDYLVSYMFGDVTKEQLEYNFILLDITGKHKKMDKRLFYKLYNKVLKIVKNE